MIILTTPHVGTPEISDASCKRFWVVVVGPRVVGAVIVDGRVGICVVDVVVDCGFDASFSRTACWHKQQNRVDVDFFTLLPLEQCHC